MKVMMTAILATALLAGQADAAGKTAFKSQKEKISYCIGIDIGNSLKKAAIDIEPSNVGQGIKDALTGKPLLTDKEVADTLAGLKKDLQAKQVEQDKKLGQKNKKEGEAFLAANKKKPGVKTLPSGLQYKILKAGSGKVPKTTDTVMVNYRGTLLNGTEFDSSQRHGGPASLSINALIAGWKEALLMMPTGSKWQLFIPANLAYGERGASRDIGPNATLMFDVELISIK